VLDDDFPDVTCPSPALTTLSFRRNAEDGVERIRRGGGAFGGVIVAEYYVFSLNERNLEIAAR